MALTKVTTGGITDATIATADIAADAVTAAKIADDAVGAEHIEQLDADLSFADSAKAKFGASNDLEISHDGSNSKIHHGGSGGLKVTCDDFQVQKNDGSEWIMRGQADGAVSLYHDNIKKLDTRSDGIIVWGPEGGDAQLRLTADEGDDGADYWRLESNASSNNFNLATHAGGSWEDKLSMNTSGHLMLGTSTKGNSTADDLTIATTSNTGITIRSGTSNEGNIFFADGTSGADEYRGTIQYNHGSNFLTLGTDGSERVRILAGGGITFNGDTATANALYDYEEGSFNPTVTQGGSVSSYGTQIGFYIKIGRLVYWQIYMAITGTANGNGLKIGNFPFTSSTYNAHAYGGATMGYAANTFQTDNMYMYMEQNSTDLTFRTRSGTILAGNSGNIFGNADFILFGSYTSAS